VTQLKRPACYSIVLFLSVLWNVVVGWLAFMLHLQEVPGCNLCWRFQTEVYRGVSKYLQEDGIVRA
jgi:hypothetical protein